jgi:hypothetical protein
MKLLPIVEGCRAVIIDAHPDDMLKEVTVGRFTFDEYYADPKQWEIDIFVKTYYESDQSELMRIDGNEDQFREEENSKLLEHIK